MDTIALVDELTEDGRKLLGRLVQENIPVTAACWVKPVGEDRWSLYIATPLLAEKGASRAYREVYRVLRSLGQSWVTDSDISLIGPDDPIAKDALDVTKRFPGHSPTRTRRAQFGHLNVEEVYIYPSSAQGEVAPRQSFVVSYFREGDTNRWRAATRPQGIIRTKARGAVGYSTAHWEGESLTDAKHATVFVYLEIEPGLDGSDIGADPDLLRMFIRQANLVADDMFIRHHPEAVITRGGTGDGP